MDFVGSFADHPWNQRKSPSAFLLTTREANGSICPDSTWLDGSPATFAAKLLAREPALDWSFRTAFIIVSWLRWIPNLVVAEWMVRQRRLAPSS